MQMEKTKTAAYTLSQAVREGARQLKQKGVENADYDSFALMSAINGMDRTYYLVYGSENVSAEDYEQFCAYITRRSHHEPLQHILGKAYFFGYEFLVNSDVLVPRPDTEILVEEVLKASDRNSVIVDMCTGSGCIILTLALQGHLKKGFGVDISEKALEVAKENQKKLSVENVAFVHSDLFDVLQDCLEDGEQADLIVSNPPYIRTEVIESLSEEVRLHDPMLALDGHDDGLHFYRKITKQAKKYLKSGGYLFYEIGYDQSEAVETLLLEEGYTEVSTVKDLAGLDRVVKGRLR